MRRVGFAAVMSGARQRPSRKSRGGGRSTGAAGAAVDRGASVVATLTSPFSSLSKAARRHPLIGPLLRAHLPPPPGAGAATVDAAVVVGLFVLGAVVRGWRIGFPPSVVFDEVGLSWEWGLAGEGVVVRGRWGSGSRGCVFHEYARGGRVVGRLVQPMVRNLVA